MAALVSRDARNAAPVIGDYALPLGYGCQDQPASQDFATARRVLLDGIARGTGIPELACVLASLDAARSTFPAEVFLRVTAGVLTWCKASRADPLPREGLRRATGRCLHAMGHPGMPGAVAFSSDGLLLAAVGPRRTALLWA